MYYKIENKESEVYQKLHALRTKEYTIQDENEKSVKEKSGLDFETYLGDGGQQNWRRVRQYTGFKFTEPEKVNPKIWRQHHEHPDIFIPNKKTKLGREMSEFLWNGLQGSRYSLVWEILNLTHLRKFTFPYVEIYGEVILIYLPDTQEPTDENVIEITKKEFTQLQQAAEVNTSN